MPDNHHYDKLESLVGAEGMARVMRRLAGASHDHHPDCIHNLPAEEQIALRGYTVEKWRAMGFAWPEVIERGSE